MDACVPAAVRLTVLGLPNGRAGGAGVPAVEQIALCPRSLRWPTGDNRTPPPAAGRHPVGTSVHSGLSGMALDEQQLGSIGGPSVMHTEGWTRAAGYDVEVTGSASNLVVTASAAV
jgi:hypothetical protein